MARKNKKTRNKSGHNHKSSQKAAKSVNSSKIYARPALIGMIGFIFQFVISVYAYYERILEVPYDRIFWITGVALIFLGFVITYLYQKEQEEAQYDVLDTIYPDEVVNLITGGVYGVVRHPGYLGTILMQLGMAFASRSYLPLIFAVFMSVFWVLTAIREEALLEKKFGKEYKEYKDSVKWKFIPGLF